MVIQGKSKTRSKKDEPRPSPVSSIAKIASLKRYADKDYALDLLHQMARAVAPIIHEYKFKVGTLCEMYPKTPNLLGLNVNRGQKILIRLRPPHNDRTFFPMSDLIGTFLHELTHNVHGPHDAKFYKFLDELRNKYETGAFLNLDYVCEENTLGAGFRAPWSTPQSVRQKRLEALSKGTFKAEARRVGGKAPAMGDLRKAMLEAAERRLKDSKWCSQSKDVEVLDDDDLEIQELSESEMGGFTKRSWDERDQRGRTEASPGTASSEPSTASPETVPGQGLKPVCKQSHGDKRRNTYQGVIDLTREEISDDEIEIITVDACESDGQQYPRIKTLRPSMAESTFSAAPGTGSGTDAKKFEMRSTVRYVVSSSPGRTFIGADLSLRRKIVADLDFDHIIESTAFVHTEKDIVERKGATVGANMGDIHGRPVALQEPITKDGANQMVLQIKIKDVPTPVKRQHKVTRARKTGKSGRIRSLEGIGEEAEVATASAKTKPLAKKDATKQAGEKKIKKLKHLKQEGALNKSGSAKQKQPQKEVRCISFQELFMN